ncbi:MAG: DUF5683 domain-containing protein [Paludibacter sp.]|nr:DUF5683 domain-containing protein [Paludibacter sp.]
MKRILNIIIIFLFILMTLSAQNQINKEKPQFLKDSVSGMLYNADTLNTTEIAAKQEFKPDPIKVVWMGAIIPGYGQIMNRKYWKLPIVYGGFLGCAYAISINSSMYETYKTAYRDIIDTDPTTSSFYDILPEGYTVENIGGIDTYTSILKTGQNSYKRYRDLSIIVTIGYYAMTLVDAFVDAQLYDFDISPDLSMRFQPTLMENNYGFKKTLGLQCSFRLK